VQLNRGDEVVVLAPADDAPLITAALIGS